MKAVALPAAPPRLLFVGLSCLDHLWRVAQFPPSASRTEASQYGTFGGGPAATAAVAAARLGAAATLWAVHGDDLAAELAMAELARYGVDVSQVARISGASSWVSAVLVAPSGERFIFPYHGRGLDDAPGRFEVNRVAGMDAVLVDARLPRLSRAALEAAHAVGVPSVGDFSTTRHWALAALVDHLIVSEECAAEVLGRDDPEAALAALRQREGQVVGITLGEEGFLYDDAREVRHVSALPVEVVDTNGAGDVFHGAYAFGVACGWTVAECGLFASVTAALACTGVGRSAIPDARTVAELLEQRGLKEFDELKWT